MTIINRRFYCPVHRSPEKCYTGQGHAWKWCRKGEHAFAQWETLNRKAQESEQITAKIKALDEEIEALKARKEELKVIAQEEKKAQADKK